MWEWEWKNDNVNLLKTTVEGFWNHLSPIIGDRLRWDRGVEVNYRYENSYSYQAIIIKSP